MNNSRGFTSDNNSGIHPDVLQAIAVANKGHCGGYGDDPYTAEAVKTFKKVFGEHAVVFFVCTGTGANVLGLRAAAQSYHAIICAQSSHLHTDECGAPENYAGCKVITLPSDDGKIAPHQIEPLLERRGDEHHSQPKFISISQPTEFGTLYTVEEITNLADFAHANDLMLHMDGARLSNAAVSLGCSLRAVSGDAGVDILSFGGTKNGMMIGEAIVFFDPEVASHFKYIRKQGMHLVSKMRFLSAQFTAYFKNDLWLHNARHANRMAVLLAQELENVPKCRITQKVQTNGVFVAMPTEIIEELQNHYFFYVNDSTNTVARLMTSFDTTEDDIHGFIFDLQELLSKSSVADKKMTEGKHHEPSRE
jgi:threonine aldolase